MRRVLERSTPGGAQRSDSPTRWTLRLAGRRGLAALMAALLLAASCGSGDTMVDLDSLNGASCQDGIGTVVVSYDWEGVATIRCHSGFGELLKVRRGGYPAGTTVTFQGVVTEHANADYAYVQHPTERTRAGLLLSSTGDFTGFEVGDTLDVTGVLRSAGQRVVVEVSAVEVVSSSVPVPAPVDLDQGTFELDQFAYLGMLVRVADVLAVTTYEASATGGFYALIGPANWLLHVSALRYPIPDAVEGTTFTSITGVLDNPRLDLVFTLIPRFVDDVAGQTNP
jgi:hypothetical protein